MGNYDPEKMAAYRLARAHSRAIAEILRKARTRGFSELVNQIRRCATSVPANVQEAGTQESSGRRAYLFEVAKGSISECWGHTDSLVDFGLIPEVEIAEARQLQNRIIALLTTMIHNERSSSRRTDPM